MLTFMDHGLQKRDFTPSAVWLMDTYVAHQSKERKKERKKERRGSDVRLFLEQQGREHLSDLVSKQATHKNKKNKKRKAGAKVGMAN
jgi:hypothetical protein